ncbi:MAG: hypothetical protein AB7K63_20990 [Vicinamibacterales bacterium]
MTVVTEADVIRHARTISGTPWQLAARLSEALVTHARAPHRAARIEADIELTALRLRLAQQFGDRHGWRCSSADFSPAVLARRGVWDGRGDGLGAWNYRLIDHPYFFRTPDRRAAAVAAHLYDNPARVRAEIDAMAARHRLRASFPGDFPSWWVPEATSLCLYVPAGGPPMP